MKRTRTRILVGLAAVVATGLLTASAPASASGPASTPASVYCDYANHMPSVLDR